MADDILGDLLRAHDGPGEVAPGGGFGDLVARAVAGERNPATAVTTAPDLTPLLALEESALAKLLRYLPADAIVPLLAKAPVPVAERIVGLLDAESQAWLAAQSEAIETCTLAAHAAAAQRALSLIARATGGAQPSVAPQPAPASAARPVQVGMQFGIEAPAAAAPAPVPAPATAAATDADLVGTLSALITLVAGRDAGQISVIADSVDHPVLAAGLRCIATGGDAHAVDETVRGAGHDWLLAQSRQVELMRLAILSMRFGDGPQRFREQAERL
jgi:hypothetical protein